MEYPLLLPGFEGQRIVVRSASFFSGAKILQNDAPVPGAGRMRHYLLRRDDGQEIVAQLKGNGLDPVPQVVIDGQVIELERPLSLAEWLAAGLPLILLMGGAVGGGLGVASVYCNIAVMRGGLPAPVKYLACFGIFLVAASIMGVVAIAFAPMHHRPRQGQSLR